MAKLNSLKGYAIVAIAFTGLGAFLQRSYAPTPKAEVEVREIVKNNIVTVTKEVTRPDGAKEVVTTVTDTSTKKERSNTITVAATPAKLWHVSLSATSDIETRQYVYGAQLEYNLIGPFSVGVRADTSKQLGIVLGFSF